MGFYNKTIAQRMNQSVALVLVGIFAGACRQASKLSTFDTGSITRMIELNRALYPQSVVYVATDDRTAPEALRAEIAKQLAAEVGIPPQDPVDRHGGKLHWLQWVEKRAESLLRFRRAVAKIERIEVWNPTSNPHVLGRDSTAVGADLEDKGHCSGHECHELPRQALNDLEELTRFIELNTSVAPETRRARTSALQLDPILQSVLLKAIFAKDDAAEHRTAMETIELSQRFRMKFLSRRAVEQPQDREMLDAAGALLGFEISQSEFDALRTCGGVMVYYCNVLYARGVRASSLQYLSELLFCLRFEELLRSAGVREVMPFWLGGRGLLR